MNKKILFTSLILGTIFTPIISIAATSKTDLIVKIPKPEEWYESPNTNITDGAGGTIFEASNGDLYAMGRETSLQVLKQGATNFIDALGSNITDGFEGTIFEASNGDLYAMGKRTGLQVLKQGTTNFIDALGSNIKNGWDGKIFETSNGDLYAMGHGTSLQVLKNGETKFIDAPGSNITDGFLGTIFQASNGDLYAMGHGTSLQVLKNGETKFIVAPGTNITDGFLGTIFQASNGDLYAMGNNSNLWALKKGNDHFIKAPDSNINSGYGGTIFQASNGDLYTMGDGTSLQVLKKGKTKFIDAPGTNINNGLGATIFQASNGDLYTMGDGTSLQVLKKGGEGRFVEVPGSNINDGLDGVIFQAKNEDLYVMGKKTSPQVLKAKGKNFIPVSGTNITNGEIGTIFQASNGDIYAMGHGTSLQVLKNNLEFKIINQTSHGTNDAIIKTKNFINHYSKLQYKNNSASEWTNLPSNGEITNLAPDIYNFQWVGKKGEAYKDDSLIVNLPDQIIKTFTAILVDAKIQNVSVSTISTQPSKKRIVNYEATPGPKDINSPVQKGFSFTFLNATPINDAGQSHITYIVDVNPKVANTITKEIIFTIGGFETKVEHAQAKIDGVSPLSVTDPTMKTKVDYEVVPKLDDLNSPIQKGFSFTFLNATHVNEAGQSDVIYIVDLATKVAGTITKEIIFTIGGFETKVEHAQAKIDGVSPLSVTDPTMKTKVDYEVVPKLGDLNSPIQKGFSFTFLNATHVNEAGQSDVIYIVDLATKVAGTITSEIAFTIGGFQTKVEHVQAKIDGVSTITASWPFKKEEVNYEATPGPKDINSPVQKGFSFTFLNATPVNEVGQSDVIYIVDLATKVVGTTAKTITFTVSDFETKDKNKNLSFILGIFIPTILIIIWLIWKFQLSKKSIKKRDCLKNIKFF